MGSIASSQRSKTENVLVFGRKNRKMKKLERLLAEHFHKVFLYIGFNHVSDLADMVELLPNDYFKVIVVTDSLGYKLNKRFFSDLRILFPHAKVLCLIDQITQEMEIAMRGTGLVFLGSYSHFGKYYQDIFQSALKSKLVE